LKFKRFARWGSIVAVCVLALGKCFYTDKRQPTGLVEVPLRWISPDTLLTAEGNSLFVRRNGVARQKIYKLEDKGGEFSFGNYCISDTGWWLSRKHVTNTGKGTLISNSGPIEMSVRTAPEGIPVVGEVLTHNLFARPVVTTCALDTDQQATSDYLRASPSYQLDKTITFEGEILFLRYPAAPYGRRATGANWSITAPRGGNLFLHDRPRGLIQMAGDEISVHSFSEEYIQAFGQSGSRSWGYAVWDRSRAQALFIQNRCVATAPSESCTRKALWLTPDLEPLDYIELPGEPLVEIKRGYTCFSCGCGCYAGETIYVEGGQVYAHVWGYPVKNKIRGIYRVRQTADGPVWDKVIGGRPQPPLAFSPSGDKVAYFEISRLGDTFRIADMELP
jgi:hypothetical protein